MQLVKLGGSVLTDKSRYRTPRPEAILRLAREVASAAAEPLMLVHGAGSYGHVVAREHKLAEGDDGKPERWHAMARVHADVRALQLLVLAGLREAGVAAVNVSTYDVARLNAGELSAFAYEPVEETLARGLLPVMSGDVALDHARGFGILSGDALMVALAQILRPKRAIFVTDVDGIFDRDPAEAGAKLLSRIDAGTSVHASAARVPDITGSMAGKLARARAVAATGVPVHIVNGHAPGRLADALAGKETPGTLVQA